MLLHKVTKEYEEDLSNLIIDSIIENIDKLNTSNSKTSFEISKLEFKYEIKTDESDLMESSFNPLFFIKSLNIKTIIKKIKELIKNIKNIINKASPVDLPLPIFPPLTPIDIPIPKIPVNKPIDIPIKLINKIIIHL